MNFLIDSNIFIYATRPDDKIASEFLKAAEGFSYSKITLIEVLGAKGLNKEGEDDLVILFSKGEALDISDSVVSKAIKLKKVKRMTLGDSIIAATAICYEKTLVTRNTDDFKNIEELDIYNPFVSQNK